MTIKKIVGPWYLKNAYFPKDRGSVFSCFSCCGGSTMGYKLAGFDVIGCNEIDPKVIEVYKANHKPKYAFNCSIRDLLKIEDLPEELYNLDILDGSPPCTSFSTAGVRDRDWGKAKKFSEGQALQRLDDLFFEFIALAKRLQPKIIIAENVTGIIKGKAKGYVKEIVKAYSDAGYITQIFKLNSVTMGVPQRRERVFFISIKKDLFKNKLKLKFDEKFLCLNQFKDEINYKSESKSLTKRESYYWSLMKPEQRECDVFNVTKGFSHRKISLLKPAHTIYSGGTYFHPIEKRHLNISELSILSSFPEDYNYLSWGYSKKKWAMGMSVPPFMMQRIAIEVYNQWIKNGPKE
jgi:DNA (cytosine-5)-methyltransferase 1